MSFRCWLGRKLSSSCLPVQGKQARVGKSEALILPFSREILKEKRMYHLEDYEITKKPESFSV